jgi:hypothetical protein
MPPAQTGKYNPRIVVGVLLGLATGFLVTMLVVNNPYDLLATLCVSAIAIPLGGFLGGFLAGITAKP